MKTRLIACLLALGLALLGPAAKIDAKSASRTAARDWRNTVTLSPEGNPVMGNPAAPVKLVEYISYACSHCSEFVSLSRARLEGDLVRRGKVSVERRPVVFQNQPAGLVAALLVHCGAPARWFGNGDMFLAAQPQWIPKAADPARQQAWNAVPPERYPTTMARDLGFYELMQQRGYPATQVTACLTDQKRMQAILATTNYLFNIIGSTSTPTFLVNDSMVSIHDWRNLEDLIDSMLAQ